MKKLKKKIGECAYDSRIRYSDGMEAAPAILNFIKVEDIGTLN